MKRFGETDMEKVKADAIRFISDDNKLGIWSEKYFNDLSVHLKLG